jgi:hypothetical protein
MCPLILIFTHGFNMTLQLWSGSVAVQKLSWTLDWSHMWSSTFLAGTLTWLESSQFFLCEYLKTKVCVSTVSTREELWCRLHQFSSEIKNTPRIFKCLRVSFLYRAELCVRELEVIWSTSCKKVRIMRLLVALLSAFLLTEPIKLRKNLRCDQGSWN